jgi:hypothetical protein
MERQFIPLSCLIDGIAPSLAMGRPSSAWYLEVRDPWHGFVNTGRHRTNPATAHQRRSWVYFPLATSIACCIARSTEIWTPSIASSSKISFVSMSR